MRMPVGIDFSLPQLQKISAYITEAYKEVIKDLLLGVATLKPHEPSTNWQITFH